MKLVKENKCVYRLPGGCSTECLLKWSGGGGDAPGGIQTSVDPLVCVECPESLDVTEPARTNFK